MIPNLCCVTMVRKVDTVNTVRQQTFAIVGSVVGTVTASTIAIATLIVLQHDSMRTSSSAEIESVRSTLSAEIESVRSTLSSEIGSVRSDVAEIRDDMRAMRSDISDLRERMARVEVHVGVTAESR